MNNRPSLISQVAYDANGDEIKVGSLVAVRGDKFMVSGDNYGKPGEQVCKYYPSQLVMGKYLAKHGELNVIHLNKVKKIQKSEQFGHYVNIGGQWVAQAYLEVMVK